MNVALPDLTDIAALDTAYAHNTLRPTEVVEEVLRRIAARGDDGVWITLLAPERLRADAADLERRRAEGERLPLYGIPYAVKDNIDVAVVGTPATSVLSFTA